MEKLKILRKQSNYTQKDLANMLGVKTEDIQNWELNKAQPELKILRDLADIFSTSVYDILSDESIATTDYSPWNFNETIDYFWGHIGILLYNSNIIKWYPITNSTFDRVETILSNDKPSKENDIFSLDTLNNRLLLINKNIVKKISLLSDASDSPKDWEIPWDGYQGLGSEEFYNLIDEYFFDYKHFCQNTSEELQNKVVNLIEEKRITEDNVLEILNQVYIYYHDNTVETIDIENAQKLFNDVRLIEFELNRFIQFSDDNGEIHFIPLNSVGLIDVPLYLYKIGRNEIFENK